MQRLLPHGECGGLGATPPEILHLMTLDNIIKMPINQIKPCQNPRERDEPEDCLRRSRVPQGAAKERGL